MIDAKDLRIGNCFIRELHASRGLEYDHSFILTEEWMGKLFGDSIALALTDLFPIPLSTDELKRCGFETITDWNNKDKRKNDCSMFLDLGYLYIAQNIMGGITLFQYDNKSTEVNFNYLHQIQNYYYTHTQKELVIKPEINLI